MRPWLRTDALEADVLADEPPIPLQDALTILVLTQQVERKGSRAVYLADFWSDQNRPRWRTISTC
jgi:hypothetical protein